MTKKVGIDLFALQSAPALLCGFSRLSYLESPCSRLCLNQCIAFYLSRRRLIQSRANMLYVAYDSSGSVNLTEFMTAAQSRCKIMQ